MDVLIGTTNPAKVNRFKNLLAGYNVNILTPADLRITEAPIEDGKDPIENAVIKASFYAQYCDRTICNDSGLFFSELPLDDPRQPGLHVRTPQGIRLNDEEMIAYYSALAKSLGGRITAYYLDAIAVSAKGRVQTFRASEKALQDGAFYLLDTPSPHRVPGWPLDSLSVTKTTGVYFVDAHSDRPSPSRAQALQEQQAFLINALQLAK